jgi:hypothetical protein
MSRNLVANSLAFHRRYSPDWMSSRNDSQWLTMRALFEWLVAFARCFVSSESVVTSLSGFEVTTPTRFWMLPGESTNFCYTSNLSLLCAVRFWSARPMLPAILPAALAHILQGSASHQLRPPYLLSAHIQMRTISKGLSTARSDDQNQKTFPAWFRYQVCSPGAILCRT